MNKRNILIVGIIATSIVIGGIAVFSHGRNTGENIGAKTNELKSEIKS